MLHSVTLITSPVCLVSSVTFQHQRYIYLDFRCPGWNPSILWCLRGAGRKRKSFATRNWRHRITPEAGRRSTTASTAAIPLTGRTTWNATWSLCMRTVQRSWNAAGYSSPIRRLSAITWSNVTNTGTTAGFAGATSAGKLSWSVMWLCIAARKISRAHCAVMPRATKAIWIVTRNDTYQERQARKI